MAELAPAPATHALRLFLCPGLLQLPVHRAFPYGCSFLAPLSLCGTSSTSTSPCVSLGVFFTCAFVAVRDFFDFPFTVRFLWGVLHLRLCRCAGLLRLPAQLWPGRGVSPRLSGCSSSCVSCELFCRVSHVLVARLGFSSLVARVASLVLLAVWFAALPWWLASCWWSVLACV